jgi:hypothetical protein
MTPNRHHASFETEATSFALAGSQDAQRAGLSLQQGIDRELGYAGPDRFVCFYYEPRAQGIRWRDSRSCGSGRGGWSSVVRQLEAIASACGMSLGNNEAPGDHVLLVDRVDQQARFAYREEAQEFLARRSMVMAG